VQVPHMANSVTILNTLQHQATFSCCGTLNTAHTGTASYSIVSGTQHTVSYSCCEGYITQSHTFKNGFCTGCGANQNIGGGIIQKKPSIITPIVNE